MPSSITFITVEEHEAAISDLRSEFWDMMQAYAVKNEEWLPTEKAIEAAQISRSTLVMYARADAPDTQQPGRITYRKEGTKSLYSRTSCISYARMKRGQPALAA
jgi:hypothetical protein